MKLHRVLAVLSLIAAIFAATTANGLINPHFTPIHLVEQAKLIVAVDLKLDASKDKFEAPIREVIKGKSEAKALTLDLTKALNKENVEALRNLATAGKPALFFVGEFPEEEGRGGASPAARGFLHVSGHWAEFQGSDNGAWAFNRIDEQMQGVWAGGTDMLHRAVAYILSDDDPDVPVAAGAAWAEEPVKIATVAGKIAAVRPVDLGDGKLLLFVACDQGDRLMACDPKTKGFSDVTAARRLTSKSQAWTWGDFSGNGRLDLVSFDGKALALHAQQADGTFQAQALDVHGALENGCVALAALGCGQPRCGLVISTNASPVLVAWDAAGKPSVTALQAPGVDLAKLGQPGPCLVADFDGDALPDVLQLLANGSVLYLGQGPGQFAAGVACPVKLGRGPAAACLADFDADGRLDVFCVHAEGNCIWQNEGGGRFAEYLYVSGEIAYISKEGGIDCMAGDINNDGRQDALIAYGEKASQKFPQLFFNRGFRSFGHAHALDLAERQLLAAAEQGQQSACLGDFDGDGAQDMVLALTNGELWVFFRQNEDREGLSVVAALPAGAQCKGPVTVTGWQGKRCLGAWNVAAGTGAAFFGRREPGPVTLKWRLPGGQPQQKEVVVEDRPMRCEIK